MNQIKLVLRMVKYEALYIFEQFHSATDSEDARSTSASINSIMFQSAVMKDYPIS